jgi:hypothetical protein
MARRSISIDTRRRLLARADHLLAGGASLHAAARAIGVAQGTLVRWRAQPRLVPIEIVDAPSPADDHVTLVLPTGIRVEHVAVSQLRRVLGSLA